VWGPEDVPKRPYPAKTFTRKFPRLVALVGALILVAILVVLSI